MKDKTALVILESADAARIRAERNFAEIQQMVHQSDGEITPETVLEALELKRSVERMLSNLRPIAAFIVMEFFGKSQCPEEIAHAVQEKFGIKKITSRRVTKIARRSLQRLIEEHAAGLRYEMGWDDPLNDIPMLAAAAAIQ